MRADSPTAGSRASGPGYPLSASPGGECRFPLSFIAPRQRSFCLYCPSCHRARPSRPGRILGVFWRNRRPDDVAALLDSVNSNDHVAPDHLNRRELLAELAFGDFNLAPLRARELAEAAREQIEQETWTPHRGRLLGHALTGLSTSKTRELSAQQSSALGLRDRLASGMLLVTHNLSEGKTHEPRPYPRGSVRRASGFVLTGKPAVIRRERRDEDWPPENLLIKW